MERRIDGARLIEAVSKQAMMNVNASTVAKSSDGAQAISLTQLLLDKLREHNILEQYYRKDLVHGQLIKRSGGVLQVLSSQQALSEEQLNMIWTSVDQYEDMRYEFYAILKD